MAAVGRIRDIAHLMAIMETLMDGALEELHLMEQRHMARTGKTVGIEIEEGQGSFQSLCPRRNLRG